MAKRKKEQLREERIDNEVVVDAYGPEERAMGWYYYLEGKIRFPFQAQCIAAKTISPLLEGEKAEVRRMAPEDACSGDMLVLIQWHGRNMAVPLSQLIPIGADEQSKPQRPLATGITGSPKATVSELLRSLAENPQHILCQ